MGQEYQRGGGTCCSVRDNLVHRGIPLPRSTLETLGVGRMVLVLALWQTQKLQNETWSALESMSFFCRGVNRRLKGHE